MPFDPVSIRSAGFYGYQHTATTARNDFNFFIFPNVILLLYLVTFFTSKKVTKEGGSYSQASGSSARFARKGAAELVAKKRSSNSPRLTLF
jgi:hypothetical protein